MRTIADEWDSARKNIPRTAPPVQFQESRRFFYAGAASFMRLMLINLDDTGNPDDVTPRDEQIMEALYQELKTFGIDIKAGFA